MSKDVTHSRTTHVSNIEKHGHLRCFTAVYHVPTFPGGGTGPRTHRTRTDWGCDASRTRRSILPAILPRTSGRRRGDRRRLYRCRGAAGSRGDRSGLSDSLGGAGGGAACTSGGRAARSRCACGPWRAPGVRPSHRARPCHATAAPGPCQCATGVCPLAGATAAAHAAPCDVGRLERCAPPPRAASPSQGTWLAAGWRGRAAHPGGGGSACHARGVRPVRPVCGAAPRSALGAHHAGG